MLTLYFSWGLTSSPVAPNGNAQDQSRDLGDRPGLSEKKTKKMALQVEQEHYFLHVDRHIYIF